MSILSLTVLLLVSFLEFPVPYKVLSTNKLSQHPFASCLCKDFKSMAGAKLASFDYEIFGKVQGK